MTKALITLEVEEGLNCNWVTPGRIRHVVNKSDPWIRKVEILPDPPTPGCWYKLDADNFAAGYEHLYYFALPEGYLSFYQPHDEYHFGEPEPWQQFDGWMEFELCNSPIKDNK